MDNLKRNVVPVLLILVTPAFELSVKHILFSGNTNIILEEQDIIVRYDGPGESQDCASGYPGDDVDQFVEEEMRLAESMSMAVFLNLNQQESQEPRRRNSNLKDVNQLETLDEVSDESSRTTPMSVEPGTQVGRTSPVSEGEGSSK